jgi:hypothetical protein
MDGVVVMSKICRTLILTICLFGCSGCKLLESLTSDVGGWNLSACVSGLDTCWDLYWDNSSQFEDGFIDTVERLTDDVVKNPQRPLE